VSDKKNYVAIGLEKYEVRPALLGRQKSIMNVAVIGAGIGGLTLAVALRRRGISTVVYEQAPEIREVGAGLWMQPNAMAVLRRLDLAEAVSAAGIPLKRMMVGDDAGRIWHRFDFERFRIAERFGSTSVAIHRGVLQSILAETAADIRIGHRLTGVTPSESRIALEFDNGRVEEADVVVGADGIHSTVRRYVTGPVELRYSGQTCWRVVIPWFLEGDEQLAGVELWGRQPGVRIGYGHISPADVYVYITCRTEAGGRDNPETLVGTLHELLADFSPKVHVMLDAIDPDAVFRSDLYDFPPLRTWWRGRMALIGDAAHATTPNMGQGACQAIESAFALAEALADTPDPSVAFARYQKRRQEKAWAITRQSFRLAQMANSGGLKGRLVRSVMKHSPLWMLRGQFEKAYRLEI
jgi:2-polyprenyl-6-methoxyphenol hydroxylase-like FAD-dependent oxidoreductase